MLKPLQHHRPSPASSPVFHYAQASRSLPGSPLSQRNPHTGWKGPLPMPKSPKRPQYVDAATQWISPIMSSQTNPPSIEPECAAQADGPENPVKPAPTPEDAPSIPPEPTLKAESPSIKRRQSKDAVVSSVAPGPAVPPKRHRPDNGSVKILPAKYELCEIEDVVVLIANMIQELIQTNDELPLRSGVLTRFHSRTPPGISVLDYLQRLAKHATLTPPLLLSMVYYIDRLCLLYPAFTINTLTVHRFLITAATVAAKGLSDSFWNNATYARVGGIKIAELGLLELDFLYRVDWKIVPNPEALVDYYRGLVERAEGYEIETETSSMDADGEISEDTGSAESPGPVSAPPEGNTDSKWKAWMDDVSSQKGEGSHQEKLA